MLSEDILQLSEHWGNSVLMLRLNFTREVRYGIRLLLAVRTLYAYIQMLPREL
jgi:hypothetical protein